jgi:hypothetical protein
VQAVITSIAWVQVLVMHRSIHCSRGPHNNSQPLCSGIEANTLEINDETRNPVWPRHCGLNAGYDCIWDRYGDKENAEQWRCTAGSTANWFAAVLLLPDTAPRIFGIVTMTRIPTN